MGTRSAPLRPVNEPRNWGARTRGQKPLVQNKHVKNPRSSSRSDLCANRYDVDTFIVFEGARVYFFKIRTELVLNNGQRTTWRYSNTYPSIGENKK
jgi:hypothetical protein